MKILKDDEAIRRIGSAKGVAVLTGAGISAESGIPIFRGEEGLWTKLSPEEMASFEAFYHNTAVVSEWYQHRRDIIDKSEPNSGHKALKTLEGLVGDFSLITQNIDGLHQRAGSRNVIELHGNIMENYCIKCNQQYSPQEFDEIYQHNPEHIPRCYCGGLIRPNVVWFGEQLPVECIENAYQAAIKSDIFLVIGTSAHVAPASDLPRLAKQNGSYLIEINPNKTAISHIVDLRLEGPSGVILPLLVDDFKEIMPDNKQFTR